MVKHRIEGLFCSVAQETRFLCEPGGKGELGHCTGLQEVSVELPGVGGVTALWHWGFLV